MKSVRLLFSLFPFAEELRPYGMAETASEFTVCLPPGFLVRFYVTCLIHRHLVLNVAPEGGRFRHRAGDRPALPAALAGDLSARRLSAPPLSEVTGPRGPGFVSGLCSVHRCVF